MRRSRIFHNGRAIWAEVLLSGDYAIREYLENYYRPNMRVKNRDATTPLGPWVVDAQDIKDPQNLKLQTRVNGKLVQDGNTCDVVLSVAGLIEYLSEIMTLLLGEKYSVTAFVNNIGNEAVYNGGEQHPMIAGYVGLNISPPHTYGLRAKVNF